MQKKQEEGKIKRRVEINEVENGQIVQKNQWNWKASSLKI